MPALTRNCRRFCPRPAAIALALAVYASPYRLDTERITLADSDHAWWCRQAVERCDDGEVAACAEGWPCWWDAGADLWWAAR